MPVAGFDERFTYADQQSQPLLRVGGTVRLECLHGKPVIARCFFVSEETIGALGRVLRVLHGLFRISPRQRRAVMMGERGDVQRRAAARDCLQHRTDAQVKPRATGCGQLVIKRFANERVRELIGARIAEFLDHGRGKRFLERRAALVLVAFEQPDQHLVAEDTADHARMGKHLVAARGQTVQARADRFLDPFRNAMHAAVPTHPRRCTLRAAEHTFCDEVACHFGHEKRIAFGLAVNVRQQVGRRHLTGGGGDELRGFDRAQTPQSHAGEVRLLRELAERVRQRVPPRELDVAIRDHHEEAARGDFRGEKLQQPQ